MNNVVDFGVFRNSCDVHYERSELSATVENYGGRGGWKVSFRHDVLRFRHQCKLFFFIQGPTLHHSPFAGPKALQRSPFAAHRSRRLWRLVFILVLAFGWLWGLSDLSSGVVP